MNQIDQKKLEILFQNYPEFKNLPQSVKSDQEHLEAAMNWLCVAQDATDVGGVSAYYDLVEKRWGKPYRETTGYIIETFLDYFVLTGKKEFEARARKMGDWLLTQQQEDGGFGEPNEQGEVKKKIFNTGQIMIGLVRLFQHFSDQKYLKAAIFAGDWLVLNQEENGSWEKFSTQGSKTYETRTAWSLIELFKLIGAEKYLIAAKKNLDWASLQQESNFWFKNTGLDEENCPWTHLIAYTINGLQESNQFLRDLKTYQSYYGSARKLLDYYLKVVPESDFKFLPSGFDSNWQSFDLHSCLTGNAQLAIIWLKIYQNKQKDFLEGAVKIIEQLKSLQVLQGEKEIKGALTGSFPVEGSYGKFQILNWTIKFFADALMLKLKI